MKTFSQTKQILIPRQSCRALTFGETKMSLKTMISEETKITDLQIFQQQFCYFTSSL